MSLVVHHRDHGCEGTFDYPGEISPTLLTGAVVVAVATAIAGATCIWGMVAVPFAVLVLTVLLGGRRRTLEPIPGLCPGCSIFPCRWRSDPGEQAISV